MDYVYIAGPLFDDHERSYLESIAKIFEDRGYKTFLPHRDCLLYTSPSPRDATLSRMPSSA